MILWLLSFLVYSTLCLGGAWLALRLAANLHPRTRETLGYTAIAVSFIIPSLHGLGPDQVAGLWVLPLPAVLGSSAGGGIGGVGLSESPFSALVWVVIGVSGVRLLHYWARLAMFRRVIGPHRTGDRGDAARVLHGISRRAGLRQPPRLVESASLRVPIAIGVGSRAAIHVPTRAFHELDREQLGALLGHEVAHHLRRDPARLGLLNVLRALLWFQPLLGVVARAVQSAAEEQCDAWAARITDRVAMARCLTTVAGWLSAGERRLPAVGMAQRRCQLGVRVDRLLDQRNRCAAHAAGWAGWRRLGAMAVIAAAPWLAPALSVAGESPPPAPTTMPAEHAPGQHHGSEHNDRSAIERVTSHDS